MSFRSIKRGLVLGAGVGALVLPATAGAAGLHGVVVQHNRLAHSLVIALHKGRLVSVHSRRNLALGRVVAVKAKLLRDGTYAAKHISVRHKIRQRVLIHGVVTFVDRHRGQFTVSAGGASLLVRRGRTAAMAADTTTTSSGPLPSVGDEVSVETQIDGQGDLEDQGVQDNGTQASNAEVEGTILSIDTTQNTLTISADEDGESGQSITVDVPTTIDITQFQVGQEVKLDVSIQPDGSFLLQGLSEDGDSGQANNPGDQQGCQGDGPDNSCSGDSNSGQDNSGSDSSGQNSSGSDSSGSDSSSSGSGGSTD